MSAAEVARDGPTKAERPPWQGRAFDDGAEETTGQHTIPDLETALARAAAVGPPVGRAWSVADLREEQHRHRLADLGRRLYEAEHTKRANDVEPAYRESKGTRIELHAAICDSAVLDQSQKALLHAVVRYTDDKTGRAYVSLPKLARRTGLRSDRELAALRARTRATGWLREEEGAPGGCLYLQVTPVPGDVLPVTSSQPGRPRKPPVVAPGGSPGGVTKNPPGRPRKPPVVATPHSDPDLIPDHTHTVGAREEPAKGEGPPSGLGPDGDAVLAELRRHRTILDAARGDPKALLVLVETIEGRRMTSGKLLPWVITAIADAAAELAAEPGISWVAATRKLRVFTDNARAPKRDPPSRDPPEPCGFTLKVSAPAPIDFFGGKQT